MTKEIICPDCKGAGIVTLRIDWATNKMPCILCKGKGFFKVGQPYKDLDKQEKAA